MKRTRARGVPLGGRAAIAGCALACCVAVGTLSACGEPSPSGPNTSGPEQSGPETSKPATSTPGTSGPGASKRPGSSDSPTDSAEGALPRDRSSGPVPVSLPWRLTKVDKKRARIYLATEVKACNLPISVRVERTKTRITVTVVGSPRPKNKMCPDYIRPAKGYVQLDHAIGGRKIAHAPTKGASAPVTR